MGPHVQIGQFESGGCVLVGACVYIVVVCRVCSILVVINCLLKLRMAS